MTPTHAVKNGKRYRYYVSTALVTGARPEHVKGRRIPAGDIEGFMLDRLRALFASGAEVSDGVAPLGLDASTQRAALDRSAKLAERWTKLASLELRELVQSHRLAAEKPGIDVRFVLLTGAPALAGVGAGPSLAQAS